MQILFCWGLGQTLFPLYPIFPLYLIFVWPERDIDDHCGQYQYERDFGDHICRHFKEETFHVVAKRIIGSIIGH